MQISGEQDFLELRNQFYVWRRRFPMFLHDVKQIERIIENHISNYSKHLVDYRRTHQKKYLEHAQIEIDEINRVLTTVSKLELMALLSER